LRPRPPEATASSQGVSSAGAAARSADAAGTGRPEPGSSGWDGGAGVSAPFVGCSGGTVGMGSQRSLAMRAYRIREARGRSLLRSVAAPRRLVTSFTRFPEVR